MFISLAKYMLGLRRCIVERHSLGGIVGARNILLAVLLAASWTGSQAFAQALQLSGQVSYHATGNTVVLAAEKISYSCPSNWTGHSGTLRLELWATTSPYSGGGISGYRTATYQLAELPCNYSYNNVSSGAIPYSPPPSSANYFTMLLTEYNNGGFFIVDYQSFQNNGGGGNGNLVDVQCRDNIVVLKFWDHAQQDDDIVNVTLGNETLVSNFNLNQCGGPLEPTSGRCVFTKTLPAYSAIPFRVTALNEGSISPNTAALKVIGGCTPESQEWDLRAGESAQIIINTGSGGNQTINYPLSVTRGGTGSGLVTSSPYGIDCGNACSIAFPGGTVVVLTASPMPGSVFDGWAGACSGGAPACTVAMDSAKAVTATFSRTSSGNPVNLNQHGLSGAWANTDTQASDAQGFVMEVFPGLGGMADKALVFAGWFTYDGSSAGRPQWYTIQGTASANAAASDAMTIYSSTGGSFADSQHAALTPVGNAVLSFGDCSHGRLNYTILDGRSGSIPLTRLTYNTNCTAQGDNGARGRELLSGAWADFSTDSQGFVIDLNRPSNVFFAAWYTFKPGAESSAGEASQYWYTMQAGLPSGDFTSLSNVAIYESTGGLFDQHVIPPPVTYQVGTASITFHSCMAATLHYAFTFGVNAGLSGTLNLSRVGPVPPGCSL